MSRWKDLTGDSWVHLGDAISGYGGGIGEHRASYFLDLGSGKFLNGRISCEIERSPEELFGAGLVFRSDMLWTFLAACVTRVVSDFKLQLIFFNEGRFSVIAECEQAIEMSSHESILSVEFYSGNISVSLNINHQSYRFECVAPHIPFGGYTGLMKLYGCEVMAREWRVEPRGELTRDDGAASGYDVFFCYASADKDLLIDVLERFKKRGITYWIDHEKITWGDPITQRIEEGLSSSRHVIVCLSKNLGRSNWCRAEYGPILNREFGRKSGKKVIPMAIEECSDDEIPLLLYDKRRADVSNEEDFENLLEYLAERSLEKSE